MARLTLPSLRQRCASEERGERSEERSEQDDIGGVRGSNVVTSPTHLAYGVRVKRDGGLGALDVLCGWSWLYARWVGDGRRRVESHKMVRLTRPSLRQRCASEERGERSKERGVRRAGVGRAGVGRAGEGRAGWHWGSEGL